MPKVSVIINCLNGERFLREAVDSVYSQTYTDWEIIFWDNASTDRTAEIAKQYDGRLRYFCGEETLALGAARNRALEQATGEFIAFLDSDDVWFPTKLEKQIPRFDDHHRIGLVYSDAIIFNDEGLRYRYYSRSVPPSGMVFRELLNDYFLSLETVVIRRSALDSLSEWFDPRFNIIEETDLFTRLSHDWQFAMVNEPLGMWRRHSANWTFTRRELMPLETEILVEKLIGLYPFLRASYGDELDVMLAYCSHRRALLAWEAGHPDQARTLLRSVFSRLPRSYVFFLLTYLPYRIYPPLEKARLKLRSRKTLSDF